jgi:hypothetical protein
MGEWFKRLIKKHTCFYCGLTVDKANLYTVKLETGEGPHEIKACKECGKHLDETLKEIEDVKNGGNLSP